MYSIRRADLRSPSRSQSPTNHNDEQIQEALRAKLRSAIELDFVDVNAQSNRTAQSREEGEGQVEEDENTFAFKLFASAPAPNPVPDTSVSVSASTSTHAPAPATSSSNTTTTAAHPQRIQLITLDDAATTNDAGATSTYLIPKRPLSYYIASPASPAQKAQYSASALTTNDILNLAKMERKGLACPWRVLHIPITLAPVLLYEKALSTTDPAPSSTTSVSEETGGTEPTQPSTKKRTRKSKKTRIKLRLKFQKRAENEIKRKEAEKAKEEHLRDKKTRMNRAKQLRKRERARLAKGVGDGGGEGGDGGENDDDDGRGSGDE